MPRATGHPTTTRVPTGYASVRVALLIPTHALPPLSYKVPARFRPDVRPGTLVVASLSGRPRLGVVVEAEPESGRAREEISSVEPRLSLPEDLVSACRRVAESSAIPLPTVLRTALPPGLDAGRYVVRRPAAGWTWKPGTVVGRATLKKALGPDGLKSAETRGLVVLSPGVAEQRPVEWAVLRGAGDPDLGRAPRQRELFRTLREAGGAMPAPALLSAAGAARNVLRELVRRGAVNLVERPAPVPLIDTAGDDVGAVEAFRADAGRAVGRGGAFVWRVPSGDQPDAVAAIAGAVVEGEQQILVLAPEIETVERVVRRLRGALPRGRVVAAYHSGLGRDRAGVHEAVRAGRVDVIVGTRAAVLLPFARLGAICVVDEPDPSHRSEAGYEGLPVHARDVAIARGRAEGAAVICLSPAPSLRLFAAGAGGLGKVRELPSRQPGSWPAVRIVDMRGSGAALSSALLDACRDHSTAGGRVGVVVDRLGYASVVSCNRCGAISRCPDCGAPLSARERARGPACSRCGRREAGGHRCAGCGSDRFSLTGLAVERVREDLRDAIGGAVGLITAGRRELECAPVVVGTARSVLRESWDAVLVPDVDSSLQGSGIAAAERSFRLVYAAAEAAGRMLLLQTRTPDHRVLRAAARGDYEALIDAELPRLRAAGYPPFAHLALVVFDGRKEAVVRAVESGLRPSLEAGVEMSEPVPLTRAGGRPSWKVLLRARGREAVARAAARAARLSAGTRGLEARVEVDPEEV